MQVVSLHIGIPAGRQEVLEAETAQRMFPGRLVDWLN